MKEVKLFVCDVCGTQYSDKIKCKKCEETHKKPVKICAEKYLPISQDGKGYPIRITVMFPDGGLIDYKR